MTRQRDAFDRYYLRMAYSAAKESPDPSTQNGAVLVNRIGTLLGRGCNEFPRHVDVTPERLERPLKYECIEHAERNAIYDAAFNGHRTHDATLYCAWAACADCARGIIQAGVVRLVRHADATVRGQGRAWDGTISIADVMLNEAQVEITDVEGKLMPNDFELLHSGQVWSP